MYSSIFLFLNMGGPEMIVIFLVVLLLFGGKKLPELARGLGKGLREFKDASDGIKREIHNNINTVTEAADMEKAKSETTFNVDPEAPGNMYDVNPDGNFNVDPEAPVVPESGTSGAVKTEETKITH